MRRLLTRLLLAAVALGGAIAVAQVRPPMWPAAPPPAAEVQAPAPPASAEPTPLVKVLREPQTWRELSQQFLRRVVDFLPRLLAAILVVLLFALFHRLASRAVGRALRDSKADPAMQAVGQRLARYVFYGFGLLMAANQLGFEVGSVLAGLGIIGIAIGFAAQDLLSNLIAGITIFWDRPIRIGDVVTIAGSQGTVTEIGLRSTRLHTPEARDVILPNKDVINETIINHTLTPSLRVDVPVGIDYGEDLRRVREVLLAITDGRSEIAERPAPHMVVIGLGESAVQVELRFFVLDARDERNLRFEMLEQAKAALDAAGIQIPRAQRVVRFDGTIPAGPPPATQR